MEQIVITGNDKPELVVIFKKEAKIRQKSATEVTSKKISAAAIKPIQDLIKKRKSKIQPLFSKGRVPRAAGSVFKKLNYDPKSFFLIESKPKDLERIKKDFLASDLVEAAYIKPPAVEPNGSTPDFTGNQGYLEAAPQGVDARFAWQFGGGRGEGIDIIDIERGFNFDHEDLQDGFGGLLEGTNRPASENHGTAVLGVMGADENGSGVTGISHNAHISAISYHGGLGTSQAIINAANRLNAGDIILLEVHRPGPAANGSGQDGFIAIEWWPDDFAAIVYATSKGIIVVEAAGNGSEDFDTDVYNHPDSGFPSSWKNPFNLRNPQSGAIIVGAGSPSSTSDRTILGFSNWGSRVDVQGWGRSVATTGYGTLQGGPDDNCWYASGFNGTSSASPVVTGALACIQGRLKARGKTLLTPTTARNIMRNTGSNQMRFSGNTEGTSPANWKGMPASSFGTGIDAALWNGKSDKIYMFSGSQYVKVDPSANWSVEPEYPKSISGNWPGFPASFASGVDAAFWSDTNNKVYFFKGNQYLRVDPNNSWNVDPGYPKAISGNWPGLPANFTNGIDAAIWNDKNNKIYFFKGDEYVRLNPSNGWKVDAGYPKPILGNWPGLSNGFTNGIDAVLWSGTNNKVYFFKGEDYVRVNPFNGWNQDPGYPKLIATNRIGKRPDLREAFASLDIDSNWPGFPNNFGQNLDAALWAHKNGKAYIFQGSQYVRVNPSNNWEVDSGYPRPIAGNWPGFPASFTNGVDAAVSNTVNNKIYFFKGSEYIRVNPNNGWKVDAGYPKPILGNWPGFPANFTNGVDGAIWSGTNNKIYFFKDDEYIRVDPNNRWKVDAGYPKPISGNWPGVTAPFSNGLDCTLWNGKSNKMYFFSGSEYLKINPANNWKVDKYYPRPIIK
ncbi:hemopexin repeat-containing protein [uncultured Tenacibaculum sp.]|uniref:hemopexin repeat-containing protein n=1 Tax=uncultured Tenacibaculum sp. TaxID=174713 RepID=UPI0026229EAF|nr:hemopexin repeat-containing protein [uncultured Tenacibaculum sp.]